MRRRPRVRLTVVGLPLVLLLGACGGTATDATPTPPTAVPTTAVPPPSETITETTTETMTPTPLPPHPNRALLRAARRGDAEAAALALRAGADLETRDGRERTALLIAATEDHVEVAKLLVAAGADPDALDDRHDTPWLVTGVTGSVAMLETLLPAHPDLTIRNRFGGLSPIPASERGHVEYVRRVVSTGVDLDHVNDLGWTAMLEAVILGDGGKRHQQIVRILLRAGADRSIADRDGVTPLQHAERRGYTEIAALLRQS